MRPAPAVALAALLVLAGCSAPVSPAADPTTAGSTTAGPTTGEPPDAGTTPGTATPGTTTPPGDVGGVAAGVPADPGRDVPGWERGVWHNESIDVNQSDGLTDAEMAAYVARAMARVEYLRGLEFESEVPVEVITRREYRERNAVRGETGARRSAWNNQVWEALFVVEESTDATDELEKLYGSNVLGYYGPSEDRLVVVSDADGPPVVDNATLVHELVHALQDQQFDLTAGRYHGRTRDADLAANGLTEGEASYVEALYARRCGEAWDCVATPGGDGGLGAGSRVNLGLLLTVLQPYSDGPVYVHRLVERGGWAAVNDAHRDPPAATEQTIHPGTSDEPADVAVMDVPREGWSRFDQGDGGADTVGEAAIAVMFWYQATHYRIDVAEVGSVFEADGAFDTYDYNATPSAGWAGDAMVPYHRDGEYAYVWTTEWDTPADAREFLAAYEAVLAGHGAERVDDRTWVIRDGGFADAFRVVRDGTRVTVVNAPTVENLSAVHPGVEAGRDDAGSGG